MESEFISKYIEKITAASLASAGVESIEKQALHLLAAEVERFAYSLGSHASKLAEASRRNECTVADIEAAALILNPGDSTAAAASTHVAKLTSDQKRKLRSTIESKGRGATQEKKLDFKFPQFSPESLDAYMDPNSGGTAGLGGKKLQCFPDWLQKEIESRQAATAANGTDVSSNVTRLDSRVDQTKNQGPLSFISSLVLAEEESREILTKNVKVEGNSLSFSVNSR